MLLKRKSVVLRVAVISLIVVFLLFSVLVIVALAANTSTPLVSILSSSPTLVSGGGAVISATSTMHIATPTINLTHVGIQITSTAHLQPTQQTRCGISCNPWGYSFALGALIYSPPSAFCDYFSCIDNFWNGRGFVNECHDGMYSKSGGIQGDCSSHGGYAATLYAPSKNTPTPTPISTPTPRPTATPTPLSTPTPTATSIP